MKVIAEFTVIPIGVGVSLSEYVAACERVLAGTGLHFELHANGTNVEGEWDAVMDAIKRCHETLHEMGVPRVAALVKIGTRIDRDQKMDEKVVSVKARLNDPA
ncbi:MAG: MTH1187 family thiamine-binding protein [Chloroflexota bacterium]